jgi:hypothetical protein
MARTLQQQIDSLDLLIEARESGNAQEEGQDAGDRWRLTSLEVLYKRRDKLQAALNRSTRGGRFQTFDAARPG